MPAYFASTPCDFTLSSQSSASRVELLPGPTLHGAEFEPDFEIQYDISVTNEPQCLRDTLYHDTHRQGELRPQQRRSNVSGPTRFSPGVRGVFDAFMV